MLGEITGVNPIANSNIGSASTKVFKKDEQRKIGVIW